MKKDLYIFRGVSGSGKTTVALTLFNKVFSADNYFYDKYGKYNFEPKHLAEAHRDCKQKTEHAMKNKVEQIAVANVFAKESELASYYLMAHEYGYRVFCLVVENRHLGKDVHNVPKDTIKGQRDRFEVML